MPRRRPQLHRDAENLVAALELKLDLRTRLFSPLASLCFRLQCVQLNSGLEPDELVEAICRSASVDAFYAAGLAAMFAGRWLEFCTGTAETADGKPLSARDLSRYSLLLGLTGVVVWLSVSAVRTVLLLH